MAVPINTFQNQISELHLLGTPGHKILEVENVEGREVLVTKAQKSWFMRLWNWITGKTAKNEDRISQVALRILQENVRSLEEVPLEIIDKIQSSYGYRHREEFEDLKRMHGLYREIPSLQGRLRVFGLEENSIQEIEGIRSRAFSNDLQNELSHHITALKDFVRERENDVREKQKILSSLEKRCQKLKEIAPFGDFETRIGREKESSVIATLDTLIEEVNQALNDFRGQKDFQITWGERTFFTDRSNFIKSHFFFCMLEDHQEQALNLSEVPLSITQEDLESYVDYLNNPACLSRLNKDELIHYLYVEQYLIDSQFFKDCMKVLDRRFTMGDALSILRAESVEISPKSLLIQTAIEYVAPHFRSIYTSSRWLSDFFLMHECYLKEMIRHISKDEIVAFTYLMVAWSKKTKVEIPSTLPSAVSFRRLYELRRHPELISALISRLSKEELNRITYHLLRPSTSDLEPHTTTDQEFQCYARFLLKDCGFDPEFVLYGNTHSVLTIAIRLAVQRGTRENIDFLKECIDFQKKSSRTAGTWYLDHLYCYYFLEKQGSSQQSSPYLTINLELVELLVNAGADVNYGIAKRLPKLLQYSNAKALLRILIERGLNVNTRVEDGTDKYNTLLIEAAKRGLKGIVELLLEHNANRTLRNQDNQTALDLAANDLIRDLLDVKIRSV